MRFLIITQDLRVSGTSQGIIERSFLAKLRKSYPKSVIDVEYIIHTDTEDDLHLLPVDHIQKDIVNIKIPFSTIFFNRFYWRLFHVSLKELYIQKQYAKIISVIDYRDYDYIFIRSAGIDCESILAAHNLPILKKAYITFNEPYPYFWCAGNYEGLSKLHLYRLKKMLSVVEQAKGCIATKFLARDMQFLYGTRKSFFNLPHQFVDSVFEIKKTKSSFFKSKKVSISYHGAIQFGRNLDDLLDVYCELVKENNSIKENTEFFVRLKSSEYNRLKAKYLETDNIYILEGVDFSTSYYEQSIISDINISLENGPIYCSVLLGKAPLLDFVRKRILSLSPLSSEMREIIKNDKYVATYGNNEEIKNKLKVLIEEVLKDEIYDGEVFNNYFSDANFKKQLDEILQSKKLF
ncbi:hypothetical protein ABS764_14005 [Flavobacterium sp. ST-87]|uniref:Uncharacterized protein n=1 Tax=Flavobacterium plantiphilum TaxID=3163297 RepID=A0ABW8XXT1_9FLAO